MSLLRNSERPSFLNFLLYEKALLESVRISDSCQYLFTLKKTVLPTIKMSQNIFPNFLSSSTWLGNGWGVPGSAHVAYLSALCLECWLLKS